MVLKGTKRSLRTGNTLRHTGDRRTDKASSVIVRHVTNAKGRQDTDEADDSHLTADGVEFSLNKKGRWNLPEVIEQNIGRSATGDAAVALLRRHRLNRQSDCLSVVASTTSARDQLVSDVVGPRTKARRRTYCNGLNVLHNGRGKSRKETRKKKVVSTKKDLAQQKQAHTALDPVPENTEDDDTTPEVRYDVFYPVPVTSSLRFHPKFTASGTSYSAADSQQNLAVITNVKPSRGSYQRCKHIDYDDLYTEDDYYHDWIYDEEEDYEDGHLIHTEHATEDASDFSERSVLFSDIVEEAFDVAVLYSTINAGAASAERRKRRVRSRKKRGGRFFYKPEEENEFDSCLEDSQSESSTESDSAVSMPSQPSVIKFPHMPSVIVELSGKATRAHHLSEQYGLRYSEAACSPRKIVLDITDRVQAAMRRHTVFNDIFLPSLDLTTYVIFTYICPSDQTAESQHSHSSCDDMDTNCHVSSLGQCSTNVSGYDVFRLQLNMNCMAQGLSFSLQRQTKFDDVEDVLEQVLTFMMTLNPENLARHPCKAYASVLKSKLTPNFSTVAEVNGWNASCVSLLDEQATRTLPAVSPHNPLQSRNVIDQEEDVRDSSVDSDSSSEGQFPATNGDLLPHAKTSTEMHCLICFSEILPGSPQGPQATALTQCQHWFCDTCWQSHMSVAMQDNGSRKLRCPEFQCHVEVDLGTLLSLQNVRDVTLHQRRQVEVNVMRMFLCKWCPNPHCGRMVKLDASSSSIVAEPTSMSCPCGQQFCFRCHGDPHWPLSCEDLSEYHAVLRKNAHLKTQGGDTAVVVRGKSCPSCRRFIEKNGGCPFMVCVCGFKFWWCCRKQARGYHDCSGVSDTTNTTKKVVRESLGVHTRHESEWYKMAVHQRSCQHPRHVRRDYQRAELLGRKLQSLHDKGVEIGVLLALPGNKSGTQPENLPTLESNSAKEKARNQERTLLKTRGLSTPTTRELSRQYVQQTTFAMIKLKMELHNVLENTTAFLHLHGQGSDRGSVSVSKVKDTVELLQFLISSLDVLLGADNRRQLIHALPWFRRLQSRTKDTLTTLTRLMNK